MKNYGCLGGLPHDYKPLEEYAEAKKELCSICGHKVTWKKDKQGRVDNVKYLEAHARNFAQPTGPTAEIYYACWHPDIYDQNKHLWTHIVCLDDECNRTGVCRHGSGEKAAVVPDITKKGTNGDD